MVESKVVPLRLWKVTCETVTHIVEARSEGDAYVRFWELELGELFFIVDDALAATLMHFELLVETK